MISKIGNATMKNSVLRANYNENETNKVKILNENVDQQRQNNSAEVNIFARQKSKSLRWVWIFQKLETKLD